MSGTALLIVAAVGAFLLLGGPATFRGLVAVLKPHEKCLPPTDASKIEMLMQMRDKDDRFKHGKAQQSINYTIECLTGTLDPEVSTT